MGWLKSKKRVLVVDTYNWGAYNYSRIQAAFSLWGTLRKVDLTHEVEERPGPETPLNYVQFALYEICTELELYPGELDLTSSLHLQCAQKHVGRALSIERQINRCVDEHDPTLIVVFQGYLLEAVIARKICFERGLKILALENTFWSDKMVWDNVSGITVTKNLFANYFWRCNDFLSTAIPRAFVSEYFSKIKHHKAGEHRTKFKQFKEPSKSKRVIFLGQVYTDSSTLFGITGFSTPIDIIKVLAWYCGKENFELILKLHPKEVSGETHHGNKYNSLTLRKLKEVRELDELISSREVLVDYLEFDTFDLIRQCDVVVTVNSQAGFEALACGKEVILCGRAFYSDLGITHNVFDTESLISSLDRVLDKNKQLNDQDFSAKAFYVLVNPYFLDRNDKSLLRLIKNNC